MNSHYVSLTLDDAPDPRLDRAVLVLESNGLRGTFFVNINSPSFARRLDEWRSVAASEHELGNHTIFHHLEQLIQKHPVNESLKQSWMEE